MQRRRYLQSAAGVVCGLGSLATWTAESQAAVASAATQRGKLVPDNGDDHDRFGSVVAVDGGTAVVGVPDDEDQSGVDGGSGYVFERTASGWRQVQTLAPGDGDRGDRFGAAVALDGDRLLVGAPTDEQPNGTKAGSVYLFERDADGWRQHRKFAADDGQPRDRFGTSVALDGDRFLVGAPTQPSVEDRAGTVYVFGIVDPPGIDPEWRQRTTLVPGDGGDVGGLVALSGDTALVGVADGARTGGPDTVAGYLFERGEDSWTERAALSAADGSGRTGFTTAALEGDTAVVSATDTKYADGACYVFSLPDSAGTDADGGTDAAPTDTSDGTDTASGTDELSFQARLTAADGEQGDGFGTAAALDGGTVVVGANHDWEPNGKQAGSAYVFERTDGSWSQQDKIAADDGEADDNFGTAVAAADGTVVVGAPEDEPNGTESGSAYVFTTAEWTPTATPTRVPETPTAPETESTTGSGPGFGPLAALAALGGLAWWRRDDE